MAKSNGDNSSEKDNTARHEKAKWFPKKKPDPPPNPKK